MGVTGELQEEDAPRLVVTQRLNLPRLPGNQPALQAVRPKLLGGPGEGDVVDALDFVRDVPLQGASEKLPDEGLLVRNAGDGAFDVLGCGHQLNSIQHFSVGLTPTG